MILTWIIIGLFQTISGQDLSTQCAAIIPGPGRTSAADYHLNILKAQKSFSTEGTCITYQAINEAFLQASKRIPVNFPSGDWRPEDIAPTGEIVLEVSRIISEAYGLTPIEIAEILPTIDTTNTLIASICPDYASPIKCVAGKYRRFDGLCNNVKFPTWGATRAVFERLAPPIYGDGISSPRGGFEQAGLPNVRAVSQTIHNGRDFHDHAGTLFVVSWGQFLDHDITLTASILDENMNDPEDCCDRPPNAKGRDCYEIPIPEIDPFYSKYRRNCMDFHRAFTGQRQDCRLGHRAQFNILTSILDGNTIYGGSEKAARDLREFRDGKLRMTNAFAEFGLRELLPLRTEVPDAVCQRPDDNTFCFLAGEIRVNEQLILTIIHTMMFRQHNFISTQLQSLNPHWNDETIYQETRRINIAQIQHITFNEFLPILLGKEIMQQYGLGLMKEGYWDGYNPEMNPSALVEFITAAFRFGHSLLPTKVERWSKVHKFIASRRLSELIRQPFDLLKPGMVDEYVMGLTNQLAQAMDESVTSEVVNHLFQKFREPFGFDLASLNLQRAREFGVRGFMYYRKYCGHPAATTWDQLFAMGIFSNETSHKYASLYRSPLDIDLWSGGVSERPLPGSMLGPVFSCIIATQFRNLRTGDRFWYELPNQPSSFTPAQLQQLRKARLARIICDNTDLVETIQLWPLILADHEFNPRVPCKSSVMPQMDYSAWREQPPVPLPPIKVARSLPSTVPGSIMSSLYQFYFN